jgi:two-component system sensor histidine kinase CpxA
MRSLFLKIFFSFWLTVVLMGVPFYFVGLKHRADLYPAIRHFGMQALARYGEDALAAWRAGGGDGLLAHVVKLKQQTGISLYLFAGRQGTLSGLTAPAEAREVVERIMAGEEDGPGRGPGHDWCGRRLEQQEDQTGEPYVIVLKLPESPQPPLPPMRHGPLDNILLYSVAGGLVCYFLARSLTSPIRKLREATNRLAGGDFSVRVGRELGRQGSEVADLGRDFDTMAERIEALLLSQKVLLRDISHELRSPLARLNVALELARQRAGAEAGPPLDRIGRESERLNELIGELMTLTLLESGARELRKENFELNGLIGMVAEDALYEARGRNRDVTFAADGKALVHGSWELMRRAVENVVRNGVHYTAEHSAVEIRLTCENNGEGKKALITVRDHGPGVPEETLSHLFTPFYRVAEARDRQSGGAGIGLAIAERAVRLHGGSMTAANAPGGGLIVTIALPLTGS